MHRASRIPAVLLLATLAACRSGTGAATDEFADPDDPGAMGGTAGNAAATGNGPSPVLPPAQLRVHPLSHVSTGADGRPVITCHLEIMDRFGHGMKALGRVRIDLAGPEPESEAGRAADPGEPGAPSGRPEAAAGGNVRWEFDLRDPERNALAYDELVTRTYVLTLGNLPGWAARWVDAGSVRDEPPTLRATFLPAGGASGTARERALRASVRLTR